MGFDPGSDHKCEYFTPVGSVMTRETYIKIENYMLQCMGDSAHDKEHIYRVLNNALVIAKGESGVDTMF